MERRSRKAELAVEIDSILKITKTSTSTIDLLVIFADEGNSKSITKKGR